MTESIVGKTVASIDIQEWAGTDTFKDTVTWERTVLTFTDGTTSSSDSWDGEVYDAYRCVFDDDGQPQRYVEETHACKHCGHGIGHDPVEGRWVAPDAGFDREGGDGIWRETCPDNSDYPNPEHEPDEEDRCTGCGRPEDICSKDPCPDVVADREAVMPEPPRDRMKNPSINYPQSEEEAAQAIIHKARRLLFEGDFSMKYEFKTDCGLGTSRQQRQADWLNQQQSIIAAILEDTLDRIDHRAKDNS